MRLSDWQAKARLRKDSYATRFRLKKFRGVSETIYSTLAALSWIVYFDQDRIDSTRQFTIITENSLMARRKADVGRDAVNS
jgi:hypothetical protein